MPDVFATPDDLGEIRQSELHASLGERLGAQATDALDPQNSLSGMYLLRRAREESAGGRDIGVPGAGGELDVFSGQSLEQRQAASDAFRTAVPDTAIDDAKARVKQEGLEGHLRLPDQASIKSPVLDLMIQEAHTRRDREAAIARGPQGFMPGALGLVTSLGAGMIDPVNMAAFSIPVLGEARWGKLMASAGDSLAARAGVRALQGGAQGAVGTAVLQPVDWWLHTRDGQDYTMADALKSIVMGAGMGAAFHAGFGGAGDFARRARGLPLAGSPEDLLARGLMAGTHVRGEDLVPQAPESRGGLANPDQPIIPENIPHPAEMLADLPPAAREDVFKATVADMTADRPTRGAEVLQIAADHDPRIAESIEAFHGSPYDFERFDVSKIDTGQGAQSYGHGLYLAENRAVAEDYQKLLGGKTDDLVDQLAGQALGYDSDRAVAAAKLRERAAAEEREPFAGIDPNAMRAAADKIDAGWKPAEGYLYRVRITADQSKMLDWDKPLNEQAPEVQAAVKRAMGISHDGNFDQAKSDRLWKEFGSAEAGVAVRQGFIASGDDTVSRRLRDAGIPGIKYLDAGSRLPRSIADLETRLAKVEAELVQWNKLATDKLQPTMIESLNEEVADLKGQIAQARATPQTHNYVVLDDKHIEITHKNGEPVKESALDAVTRSNREARAADPEFYARVEGRAGSHGQRVADAAEDPRWRELADAPPAHSTPEAISESHAADAVAEPASVTPKALTAIEQAAADAEEAWRKVEGSYTEAERAVVNDALAKLDLDRKEVEDLITEGAACLMAAEAA